MRLSQFVGQPQNIFVFRSFIGNFSTSPVPTPQLILCNQAFSIGLCLGRNCMSSLSCPMKRNRSLSDVDISASKMGFGMVFRQKLTPLFSFRKVYSLGNLHLFALPILTRRRMVLAVRMVILSHRGFSAVFFHQLDFR